MASVAKRPWKGPSGEIKSAWVVRYKEGGKHRSKQFEKKKDADKFRQKVEREIADGVHVAPSETLTVKELCEEYLRWQESRWKDGRIGQGRYRQIKSAIDTAVLPHLGHRQVTEITSAEVERWYALLCRLPRRGRVPYEQIVAESQDPAPSAQRPSKKLLTMLPSTAKERVRELLFVFNWGEARGRLKRNVVTVAMRELKGVRKRRVKTPTADEVLRLIQQVEIRPRCGQFRAQAYLRCAVHLAAFCGLRWGEIMGLTLGNIDLDARIIHVRHSLTHWDELKGPKSESGIRDVFMPSHLRDHIAAWNERFYVPNDRQLMFRGPDGAMKDAASFHRGQWWPLLKRAGLWEEEGERLHFHALRHFAVSAAIHSGLPLTDVPAFIGHRDLNTTLGIYTHTIGNSRQDDIASRMAEMLLAPAVEIEGTASEVSVNPS